MGDKWKEYKLGELLVKTNQGVNTTTEKVKYSESGIPVIRAKNIYAYKIDFNDITFVDQDTYSNLKESVKPKKGDILYTNIGSQLGNAAKVEFENNFLIAWNVFRIQPDKQKVNPDFLTYLLNNPTTKDFIRNLDSSSTMPFVSGYVIEGIDFLIPPLPEQKAIASILGALDDKIEMSRKMNETLEAMAKAIFKSWFVDFDPIPGLSPHKEWQDSPLGKIPKGWRVGTIEDLGHVICGKTPPTADSENYGTEMPFITIPDMHRQIFIIDTEKKLSRKGVSTQPSKTLPALSICVSCIATPGLVVLTSKPSQTNQQINSVIPKKEMSLFYCYMALNELAHEIKARGSGGSVTLNLNKTQFAALPILLPDTSNIEKFHLTIQSIFDEILSNAKQSLTLAAIRDALMPKLLSGEIRVRDAESKFEL